MARFLETLREILGAKIYDLPLEMYLGTCAKCNNCAEQCQIYQTSGDQRDLPAWRSDLLRKVYKKYFTRSGKLFGRLVGAKALTEEDIDDMVDAFYRCTMCRRCGVNCPLAVDNALITRIGRVLLESLGFVPTNMTVSTRAQLGDVGNTSAIPKPAFIDTLDFLEEELKDETGIDIPIPRDVEGAEYFFAAPVSDYIMEADTLLGIAKTFHAAGASWTVSTENYDAINYGLFYSDEVLEKVLNRLLEPVHRLKCKTLVIGECGHATKSGFLFQKVFGRPEYQGIQLKNIIEVSHRFSEGRETETGPLEESGHLHLPRPLQSGSRLRALRAAPGASEGGGDTIRRDDAEPPDELLLRRWRRACRRRGPARLADVGGRDQESGSDPADGGECRLRALCQLQETAPGTGPGPQAGCRDRGTSRSHRQGARPGKKHLRRCG